jgi:hypothetical protein
MKKWSKKRGVYIVFLIFVILFISTASAGVFDWLKKITGGATSRPTNMSITIAGNIPISIRVWNQTLTGTSVDPTEESFTSIVFNITVIDGDGVSDINDSSVKAELYNATTRKNISACSEISGESTSNSSNYTCSVDLWYWDTAGTWTINVTANDLGNQSYISNNTETFNYDQLQAIKISPAVIYWPTAAPGDANTTANTGNYTIINNTGNYNATGNVAVNALHLYSGANFIDVKNFTVDIDTGGSPPAECDGTVLQNGTNATISDSVLEAGNLSLGESNESIYYCLTDVPSTIPSGTYDTSTAGSWSIRIT